jgi:hypothetical protein
MQNRTAKSMAEMTDDELVALADSADASAAAAARAALEGRGYEVEDSPPPPRPPEPEPVPDPEYRPPRKPPADPFGGDCDPPSGNVDSASVPRVSAVRIVDVDIPFLTLMGLLIKIGLAAIPAGIVVGVVVYGLLAAGCVTMLLR